MYDDHYNDYAYDAYMDSLYDEHKELAIDEFATERLQSYFHEHPDLALAAHGFLQNARRLAEAEPTAAALFGAIAVESGVKAALLRPIVYGLVHRESVATLVADLVLRHSSFDRFKKLLFELLREHSGVDLATFRREGASPTLWEETHAVQVKRSQIMHRAEEADTADAALAIAVGESVLEQIFPEVVKNLGFHLHEMRVCGDQGCVVKQMLAERGITMPGTADPSEAD